MEQQRDPYRQAAESLLSSNSFSRQMLGQSSVNLIASQEAAAGWRRGGRMSSVRRFFCLFCTFDLLFTMLVWLISVMLTGQSIWQVWETEVIGYGVGTSLLDVVGVAAIRFLLLLLAYAAFHMDHWAVVALTTSGTCTFLIAKVFIFDWIKTAQPVFQVLLVLMSFSLCWGEAWFLDCKVLPQESLCAAAVGSGPGPYLFPVIGHTGPSDLTSIGDFYSPTESPEPSPRAHRKAVFTTPIQDVEYCSKGEASEQESLQLLSSTGWKKEKAGPQPGDTVEVLQHPVYGKIFKLTSIVDCPAEQLFKELTDGLENMPQWSPTMLKNHIIKDIDDQTSLTYLVSTGGPRNAVKPRDFVNVRRINRIGSRLITSSCSIELPQYPPTDEYVRGHNGLGCWCVDPYTEGGVNKSIFRWVMALDLKGWLPQYVKDIAFSTAQLEFLQFLRMRVANQKSQHGS